ncbi:uncharacterized protein L969DRAFT_91847 [Mixia osmundae IAM 14324]|uniref:LisH domain-containing protein n=1 Tax=Mixia osmundae (strain CBS 9802 / IAM 14324 / JCM 22182 / KY 12970) TaxID=764103 RepID=G7E846_MIXOS|nr:uncharacterized protein L969DRAFT_91847 [Mixia osmundae IAM 14324]KEI42402.1 hypothetical protein L969DRAFT_91847 [Mixia osmundae IAM 14324]GAA99006.1 hypothetical protein E5Q_05695 [Mixia osmundae IAM 14324]
MSNLNGTDSPVDAESTKHDQPKEARPRESEQGREEPGIPPMTSEQINLLILTYLSEAGFKHSSFAFLHESRLSDSKMLDLEVPPARLIRLLHKALLYLEAEARFRGDDTSRNPPRLVQYDIPDALPLPSLLKTQQAINGTSQTDTRLRRDVEVQTTASDLTQQPVKADLPHSTAAQVTGDPSAPMALDESSPRPATADLVPAEEPNESSLPVGMPAETTSDTSADVQRTLKRKNTSDGDADMSTAPHDIVQPGEVPQQNEDDAASAAKRVRMDEEPVIQLGNAIVDGSTNAHDPSPGAADPVAPISAHKDGLLREQVATEEPALPTPPLLETPIEATAIPRKRSKSPAISMNALTSKDPPPPVPKVRALSPVVRTVTTTTTTTTKVRPGKTAKAAKAIPPPPRRKPEANDEAKPAVKPISDVEPQSAIKTEPAPTTLPAPALAAAPRDERPAPLLKTIAHQDVMKLKGHSNSVQACSWNPKVSSMLATGSHDSTARIWDVPLTAPTPNATLEDSVLCKHASAQRKADVPTCRWNPDGTLFATGSEDGIARVWTPSGDLHLVLSMHQQTIYSLRWNSTGTMLLTGSLDHSVCLWELGSGRVKQQWESHADSVLDVDWLDDTVMASGSMDKTIHILKIGRSSPVHRFKGHQDEVNTISFDPGRTMLASGSDDQSVRVWSMRGIGGNATDELDDSEEHNVINRRDGCLILEGHEREVHTLAWHPGTRPGATRILASGSFDGDTRLWDVDKGTCIFRLSRHTDFVYSLAFLPFHGTYLATASNDGLMSIWRVADGKLLMDFQHEGPIYEIAWHPARPQIAVGGLAGLAVVGTSDLDA